jgi:NADH:ubiquinone oxidoreductase subunit F (NADH-binding)
MLSNVETFARLAVAIRGLPAGSALASASGAVRTPGVVELAPGRTLGDLAAIVGVVGDPRILVTGGWHGRWIEWDPAAVRTELTRAGLADLGGRWGAGAFVWIDRDIAPVAALAAIAGELAEGTAGQCGPCWRGLPEAASLIARAADGSGDWARVEQVLELVDGRGICAHPSASVAALRSALDLIGRLP